MTPEDPGPPETDGKSSALKDCLSLAACERHTHNLAQVLSWIILLVIYDGRLAAEQASQQTAGLPEQIDHTQTTPISKINLPFAWQQLLAMFPRQQAAHRELQGPASSVE